MFICRNDFVLLLPLAFPVLEVTMTQWPLYLRTRGPRAWWIENVPEIGAYYSSDNDAETHLELFMRLCCAEGYAVRAFHADHNVFSEVPRPRTVTAHTHSLPFFTRVLCFCFPQQVFVLCLPFHRTS